MNNMAVNHRLITSQPSYWRMMLELGILLLVLGLTPAAQAAPERVSQHSAVQQFIQEMATDYEFDKKDLIRIFDDVQFRPDVITAMDRPKEAISWYRYRELFMTEKRIQRGVQFWRTYAKTLARAQQRYGVPPAIITAIIGVETFYGDVTGGYRVIDTLSTLAFSYPSRAKFFREELKAYLLLTRDLNLDPLELRGSYAGAIGLPQFMPSNYRVYAVDAHHSQQVDLLDPEDAILSVANYFKNHGWQTGQPVATRAKVASTRKLDTLINNTKTRLTLAQWVKRGVRPVGHYNKHQEAALIQLAGEKNSEYWLVFPNFTAIMRYNNSINYAMTVYQLSQAITQQMGKKSAATPKTAAKPAKAKATVKKSTKKTKPKAHPARKARAADQGISI